MPMTQPFYAATTRTSQKLSVFWWIIRSDILQVAKYLPSPASSCFSQKKKKTVTPGLYNVICWHVLCVPQQWNNKFGIQLLVIHSTATRNYLVGGFMEKESRRRLTVFSLLEVERRPYEFSFFVAYR